MARADHSAGMRRSPLANCLLLAPAIVLVLALDAGAAAFRRAAGVAAWLGQRGRLPALEARIGRLPPAVALPLFLVPEICSRFGWLTSGWLLLQGRAQAALLVYLGSKLVAGLAALWIFRACEPALMRIGWFAALHGITMGTIDTLRARLLGNTPGHPAIIRARQWLLARKRGMTRPTKHDN